MQIYPHFLLRPKYAGEAKIYTLLSRVPGAGFAVHSVNLPDHQYKRWGEADFVVVAQSGVTLLEVKGGTVSLTGREWRYENARGQLIRSTEGPARQALSAAIALEEILLNTMHKTLRCRWGVCFPLCKFSRTVAELPASRLADISICSNDQSFQEWLQNIPSDSHNTEDDTLDDHQIEHIREILVPLLSASNSLGLAANSISRRSFELTEQQFQILDSLEATPRLCISGGAGTGKTELASLVARAERTAGRKPTIVTKGSALTQVLTSRMAELGIPVSTDTLPKGTDTLIVDEGQDFVRPGVMETLFSQLPGGLNYGRWRWFMDPNLQFTETPPDSGSISALRSASACVTLKRNVRSTVEIVSTIRDLLHADVGVSKIDGFGIKVTLHRAGTGDDELMQASELIRHLMDDSVKANEIAVLSTSGQSGNTSSGLLRSLPDTLASIDHPKALASSTHGIVSSISQFRGLEAPVVILVDMDQLPHGINGKAQLYMGMSRASASLHIFVTQSFAEILRQFAKQSPN
jgi:hypothetical protein